MPHLLTILTIRSASERLPGKALLPIKSKVPGRDKRVSLPLVVWITRRLRQLDGSFAVATTLESSDNELVKVLEKEGVTVIRGATDDVVGRMQAVINSGKFKHVTHVLRALGDCPFIHTAFITHAVRMLEKTRNEAIVYHLAPDSWPVYGSREFPFNLDAWSRIVRRSTTREHTDVYFHNNRREFKVLYHQAPDKLFFRPYRLEVDWQEDLELVQAIAEGVGMLAELPDVIKFLDANPDIASLNADRQESTGPLSLNSYTSRQRQEWLIEMQGKPVMLWNERIIEPPGHAASPIFCSCGASLGWGWRGQLHLIDANGKPGSIMTAGFPKCGNCGLIAKEWKRATG